MEPRRRPLLQRFQPLLEGLQTAEDFVEEVVKDALEDFATRVARSEGMPLDRITQHKELVLGGLRTRLQKAEEGKIQCRAKTKARKRCKCNAQWPTEFCGRHTMQRDAHRRQVITHKHMSEHDAMVRARSHKGHNHKWKDAEGYHADCAVCKELCPCHITLSFSGQSHVSDGDGDEVSSVAHP